MPRSRARGSRQFGGRRVRSRTPPKSRPRHTRRSSIRARASSRQGRPTYPLRPGGRDRRGRESSRRRRACQRGHLPGVARARPCGRDRRRDGSDSICQLETPARRAAHPDPRSRHRLRLAASRRRGARCRCAQGEHRHTIRFEEGRGSRPGCSEQRRLGAGSARAFIERIESFEHPQRFRRAPRIAEFLCRDPPRVYVLFRKPH